MLRLWTPSTQYVSSFCISAFLTYHVLLFRKPKTPALTLRARLLHRDVAASVTRLLHRDVFVSQEDRTALIWAAINGKTEIVKDLIAIGADAKAKEKVRRRYCVITGVGANYQRMFGIGLRDLGATGRECPLHCSCGLCHGDQLTIHLSRVP
jgi:hypothetical protein